MKILIYWNSPVCNQRIKRNEEKNREKQVEISKSYNLYIFWAILGQKERFDTIKDTYSFHAVGIKYV